MATSSSASVSSLSQLLASTGLDSRPPDEQAEALRMQGNDAFRAKRYHRAEELYSAALDLAPAHAVLYANRAATRLEIKVFKMAYHDAVEALRLLEASSAKDEDLTRKALYRKGKSEEGLRLWSKALESYTAVLKMDGSAQAQSAVARMKKRVGEATRGDYDWLDIYRRGLDTSPDAPPLDVADYVGPFEVVEMQDRGGGRGAHATRDVKAGELILVERAFATQHPQSQAARRTGVDSAIHSQISNRISEDGSLARVLLSLYAGPNAPKPLRPPESFDIDLASRVSASVNLNRIAAICTYNAFGEAPQRPAGFVFGGDVVERSLSDRTSLYIRAAYLNHSCAPNVRWSTYIDTIVLRARCDIAKNEELFVGYTACEGRPEEALALAKHFPAGCCCDFCSSQRQEAVAKRQDIQLRHYDKLRIALRMEQGQGISVKTLNRARAYVRDLEATYPTAASSSAKTSATVLPEYKPQLVTAYHLLAEAETHHDMKAAVKTRSKAYEAAGGRIGAFLTGGRVAHEKAKDKRNILATTILNHTFCNMLLLSNAATCYMAGLQQQGREWLRAAMRADVMCVGEGGSDLLRERYGEVMKAMGLHEG